MAYLCSAVIIPSQSRDLRDSIAKLRTRNDKVAEIRDCSSLGTLICHFTAGRPHEVGDQKFWKTIADGELSEVDPASSIFASVLSKAEKYSDVAGYGYYSDTRIPSNALKELCDLSSDSGMPIWVYFSEASGGSLDCEYSWLITPKEVKLIVWDEEHEKYIEFSSAMDKARNIDAFSAGIDFMAVRYPNLLKDELFVQ